MAMKYPTTGLVGHLLTKPSEERIAANRRLLQNPYAYLNDLGSFSALPTAAELASSPINKIIESRKLLQDPYAYIDDVGGYSAARDSAPIQDDAFPKLRSKVVEGYSSLLGNAKRKSRHSDIEIEREAIDLQKRMWRERNQIWGNTPPSNPIDVLDPSVAIGLIGYDYDLSETLGQYFSNGKQVEVAGIIDDSSKQVRISRQFRHDVRNFTAAHELGHALLHDARGLHRDRPLDGATISRDAVEFEADKFASYFLMPEKLLKAHFKDRFSTEMFSLNEGTSFALARGNSLDLANCQTLRDLSRVLATAECYNETRFISLANQFRVSAEAMAIRIEELKLLTV